MVIKIPEYIEDILNIINQYGEAYVVGGCIRDSLLGYTPHDWDITTDRLPEEIKEIFKDYKIIDNNGIKHGTVTILYKRKLVEITTYRVETNYSDGRHPDDVAFTRNLANDLARRDFTINALAYNNKSGLIDLYGGIEDLNNKIIRTVGNPEDRFKEDYLRILRGVRFVSKLNFNMEKSTFDASLKLSPNILKYISGERIREELKGILLGPNVLNTLLEYHDIIFSIIPELKECYKFEQNNIHHMHDVYTHICYVVSYTKPIFETRLAALLHDIGKPKAYTEEIRDGKIIGHFYDHQIISTDMGRVICNRVKLSNEEKRKVLYLVLEHDSPIGDSKRQLKSLIMRTPEESKELVYMLIDLKMADNKDHSIKRDIDFEEIKKEIEQIFIAQEALKITDLKINGLDLINSGYSGSEIGNKLKEVLNLVVDGELKNDRDILLAYINKRK